MLAMRAAEVPVGGGGGGGGADVPLASWHSLKTPTSGSRPKKVFVHWPPLVMERSTHVVPERIGRRLSACYYD